MKLKWLKFTAWASFVLNVVIIGTGGAVRLTGSGLGCSDWPLCTPGNLTPTPEQSYHALIEFGNRTISGPLLIAAIAVLLLTLSAKRERRDLKITAVAVLVGVIAQAIVGAFVVWMHLNANLVGFHYVASLVIVGLTVIYLVQLYDMVGSLRANAPANFARLTYFTAFIMAVSIFFGILTTGAGPHSGDANIQRDGIDAVFLSHVHAWPGYLFLGLLLVLIVWSARAYKAAFKGFLGLLILAFVQIAVGVYQARNGLPALAVGIHMVLAALNVALMTQLVMRLKGSRIIRLETPAAQQESLQASQSAPSGQLL